MGKRNMALALVLCLLLSGCGGTGGGASSAEKDPAQQQTAAEISAVVLDDGEAAEPAEDSQAELELDSLTPEELGQWLWAQMEAYDEASYAKDYDMEMSVAVEVGGESTVQKASGRVKKIDSETDGYMFYENMQVNGAVTENWYGGGCAYLSDSYGKYKSPMDKAAYDELMNGENAGAVDKIDHSSFGTLTAEKTDRGYIVTYGDPASDTWTTLSDGFVGVDENTACTALTLDGTIEMDENGAIRKQSMEITGQFDVYGETMTQTIYLTQTIINYDDDVSIRLPADDADFREISNISLPETFLNGFSALLSQYGVSYQAELGIRISDGTGSDEYVEDNTVHYIYGLDNCLYLSLEKNRTLNGEVIVQSSDNFSAGKGTVVDETGESTYTYDDALFLMEVQSTIACYTDCFSYGSDYQLEQDGDNQKLTMSLDSEYVEAVADSYLSSMDAGIDFDEASKIVSEGTMSFWINSDGMIVMQRFEGTCTLSYTGAELTVSIYDQGDVLTINAGVAAMADA